MEWISVDSGKRPEPLKKVLVICNARVQGDSLVFDMHMAGYGFGTWRQDGTGNVLENVQSWVDIDRLMWKALMGTVV